MYVLCLMNQLNKGLYEVTTSELRKLNPSEFGNKATIDVMNPKSGRHIYVIYLVKSDKYKSSETPYGWESTVEDAQTYKMISCTPGASKGLRPYYIDEFLHRN